MSLEKDILIERFLKNELSETERKQVLERINSDAIFREKLLFEQQLLDTLDENSWSFAKNIDTSEAKEYEDLFKSDEIKSIKQSIAKANKGFKTKKYFRFRMWQLYSSAAVIALLISVYIVNPKSQTSEEIYSNHINAFNLPSIINRGGDTEFEKLSLVKNYFENKNYLKIVNLYSKEINNNESSIIYLSLAISQMELNQFQDAEKTLNSFIKSDFVDAEKGYWLKSLLYLKSEQIEKAKTTLSLIIKNAYFNYKKAEEVLKKI